MNWINSWREGNKKNIIDFTLRFGVITLFELKYNPGVDFRFLLLNFGIETIKTKKTNNRRKKTKKR